MVCSIFMASSMTSGVPRSTTSPGLTATDYLPGMGAVRRPPATPLARSGQRVDQANVTAAVGDEDVRSLPTRTTVPMTRLPARSTRTSPLSSRAPARSRPRREFQQIAGGTCR